VLSGFAPHGKLKLVHAGLRPVMTTESAANVFVNRLVFSDGLEEK